MVYWVIPWHCLVVFLGITNVGVKFEAEYPQPLLEKEVCFLHLWLKP